MADDVDTWIVVGTVVAVMLAAIAMWLQGDTHRRRMVLATQRNRALTASVQALQQAQETRAEFMAWVGHELRTPMSAMLGLNPLLREAVARCPEDVAMVDLIRSSTEQLLEVVNDTLDLSQLQAGRMTLSQESFLLEDALNEVIAMFQTSAQWIECLLQMLFHQY